MFWDKVAFLYDFFENVYNGKVNREMCQEVAMHIGEEDRVLECACGTGMLSRYIGCGCKELIATDYSEGMLRVAARKYRKLKNITFKKADITNIKCKEGSFDKVVAGNVLHLLDHPDIALAELYRVCKHGGQLIIPTYVNDENKKKSGLVVWILEKMGADFKRQYTFEAYQKLFAEYGFKNVEYKLIKGNMPCAIAIINKK